MSCFATTGSDHRRLEEGASYPRAPGRSAGLAFAFVYTGVRAMKKAHGALSGATGGPMCMTVAGKDFYAGLSVEALKCHGDAANPQNDDWLILKS